MNARRPSAGVCRRGAQAGALIVEALVALALAMVAALALLQAEVGARAARVAAQGQMAAVVAVRTAHEAVHPLMENGPLHLAARADPGRSPLVELAIDERPAAGVAAWSLVQRSVQARWTLPGQRLRHWRTVALQWQAPADLLGWLDAQGAPGVGASPDDSLAWLDRPSFLVDPLGWATEAGEGLGGDADPWPTEVRASDPGEGSERPIVPVEGMPAPSPRTASGLGPARPASAARFDAALRQVRTPSGRGPPGPGWRVQSGALRVDPAITRDPLQARALQDWIARVIEPVEGRMPSPGPSGQASAIAARPSLCDLQPVDGWDPHLAWRCLGWQGAADLFLLPRTGLPTGWVLCRFRVPESSRAAALLQAPAPRVHAWIGLGSQGCPADADRA